jgi:hypothetical protein
MHKPAATSLDANRAMKNKAKGKIIANPDSGPDDSEGDSDEEYASMYPVNGTANGQNGKGKGKGKAPVIDGFVDTEEEDLYS